MQKQTVEQRYKTEQIMNNEIMPKRIAEVNLATEQQENIQKIFNSLKQALQEAHHSVRRAQLANPTQQTLIMTDQRLTNATQLFTKLQTNAPNLMNSVPTGTQQQLKQLDYEIEKAAGTLQLIQQSMSHS